MWNGVNEWVTPALSVHGDMVVDGTIGANKIVANSITTDHIAANSISADRIATGTITAASGVIANFAVDTLQIASNAVTIPLKFTPANASTGSTRDVETLLFDTNTPASSFPDGTPGIIILSCTLSRAGAAEFNAVGFKLVRNDGVTLHTVMDVFSMVTVTGGTLKFVLTYAVHVDNLRGHYYFYMAPRSSNTAYTVENPTFTFLGVKR
jgi:hypothetical protein